MYQSTTDPRMNYVSPDKGGCLVHRKEIRHIPYNFDK